MFLYGLGLSDGCGNASDTDLHHCLVIVIILVVLVETKQLGQQFIVPRNHEKNGKTLKSLSDTTYKPINQDQ